MNYTQTLGRLLENDEVDFNIDSLAVRMRQAGVENMPVILRRDLPRPLTNREMDHNFQILDLAVGDILYGDGPRPSLDLRFSGARFLDPRITFTRASTATYYDATGKLVTAAPNEPRFAYDPATGAARGLLVEGQATNLARYSVITNANWSKAPAAQVTDNYGIAPDGTQTSAFFSGDGSGSTYISLGSVSTHYIAGVAYTASAFFKPNPNMAGSGKQFMLYLHPNVFGTQKIVNYNDATGDVTSTGDALAYGIEASTGGWRRIWVSGIAEETVTSWSPIIRSLGGNLDAGQGWEVWGMQLEEGPHPTSYIPTDGSQVTRASDGVIVPTSDWFNPNEGTFIVDFVAPESTGYNILIGMGSASVEEFRLECGTTSNFRIIARAGATQTGSPAVTIQPGQRYKAAASYRPTSNGVEWKLVVSGNVIGTAETERLPTGFVDNGVAVGRRRPNSNTMNWNGTAANIAYYPRALSDAELQALTS